MERFAESQGLVALERWCVLELKGYEDVAFSDDEKERTIKYQYAAVDWLNQFDQKVTWENPESYILNPPIWMGIEDLESYLAEGLSLHFKKVNETSKRVYGSEIRARVSIEQL